MSDFVSRDEVYIAIALTSFISDPNYADGKVLLYEEDLKHRIDELQSAQPDAEPDAEKYEYHYDHTDCIWYRPEARNRCPATCAQYRDGWNDAMNYIFRDGKGYRPFRRDKKYEE